VQLPINLEVPLWRAVATDPFAWPGLDRGARKGQPEARARIDARRVVIERAPPDEFLLRPTRQMPLSVVPDRFGLMFSLAASGIAIAFASIAFAIALLG
jgi:hypothetical protein